MWYEELLARVEYVPITEGELEQVFVVDAEGNPTTLREYINQHEGEGGVVVSSMGTDSPSISTSQVRGKRRMDEEEITRLVEQYLESMPDDEVLAIIGEGNFTKQQLRKNFRNRTAVGERLAEMVLDGHMFVDEAIKLGKIRIESEKQD